MIIIWIILIILSILFLVFVICVASGDGNWSDASLILVIGILLIGGVGWGLCGGYISVKHLHFELNKNNVQVIKTKTSTIISYKNIFYQEYDDAKTYLYVNKNSKFYYDAGINMYHITVDPKLIIDFK